MANVKIIETYSLSELTSVCTGQRIQPSNNRAIISSRLWKFK